MTCDRDKEIDVLYGELFTEVPERKLKEEIEKALKRCGIMYRVFSRVKDKKSLVEKLNKKREKYEVKGKKLQDIIGIRIVLYFKDDIDICIKVLSELFEVDNYERDAQDTETFKPQRINYVFKIPTSVWRIPDELSDSCRIDNTFEVQIRTIFSEGWHEVEHDIRYKYKDEWKNEEVLSRELNGIMAVLEICDNNILSICEEVAYRKYKEQEWESMIRNKFRLRIQHEVLDIRIEEILNKNLEIGKEIFRYERLKLIEFLAKSKVPLTCNNIVYIINELYIHNSELHEMAPSLLIEKCKGDEQ